MLTFVGAHDERQIAAAVRRELLRDGQVFFIHNRVRSINRAAVVVGAPLGGLVADSLGYRPALLLCAGGVAAAGLALLASPFRAAR